MTSARFQVDVSHQSALEFAALSGDWNPLHTDSTYAADTAYRRPVLHGAFSAGLVSRMAGMFLPGTACLLHGMQLRFLAPIIPPAKLTVDGVLSSGSVERGRVAVTISDASSGVRYVEAHYEFGEHDAGVAATSPGSQTPVSDALSKEPIVLVTGASGGLGSAICASLGDQALGVYRNNAERGMRAEIEALPSEFAKQMQDRTISAIVHCAWPSPDNVPLSALPEIAPAVDHFVAAPLRQMIALSQLLLRHGTPDALLLLVGSTAAASGRHNYRMPLYGLGKSLIPELTRALAVELGATGRRAASVVFDVVETGMNQRLSKTARMAHANRSPTGLLPDAAEAAAQVSWMLANRSSLLSGAVVTLSGGALP